MADLALDGATIVFDLDGTLVDSAPDLVGTLNALLADEDLAPLPFQEGRRLIGRGARSLLQRGFEAAGQPLDTAGLNERFDRFIAHYRAHIADGSRAFPGCEAALDRLADRGATLAVCTNKRTELSVALLEALDLAWRFKAIVGADAAPAMKPDPRHLQLAVDAAGGRMARTVMVGDAAPDAGAARAAGAHLALVSFGYTDIPVADLAPDALIHAYEELPAACGRLLGACGVEAEPL